MLQIVLFRAWLNLRYPNLATPIRPIIDKLLVEEQKQKRGELPISSNELYQLIFGTSPRNKI